MTLPFGLLDQSAVARLLASMQGPSNNVPQPPQMGGLMAPQLPSPVPFNPNAGRSTSPGGDPTHDHRSGIRGGLLHAVGADQMPPELAALLTPDQQKRVKPGLLATVGNAVLTGRGPQAVMQDRAMNLIGLQDAKKARELSAQQQQMMAQIQQVASTMPEQEGLEYTARMYARLGLGDFDKVSQAAARLRTPPPQEVSRGAAVIGPDGQVSIPAPIVPEAKPVLTERPHLGGVAQFEDGAFKKWVLPPKGPVTLAEQRMASTYAAQNRSIDDTLDAIKTYRKQLMESGVEVMPGVAKSKLTGAYSNLKLKAKEAANLGALTGPDVVILEELFNNPATLGAAAKNILTGGRQKEALLAQLDQYEQIVKSGKARLDQNYTAQSATKERERFQLPNPREEDDR
jgi:hypothetical protein